MDIWICEEACVHEEEIGLVTFSPMAQVINGQTPLYRKRPFWHTLSKNVIRCRVTFHHWRSVILNELTSDLVTRPIIVCSAREIILSDLRNNQVAASTRSPRTPDPDTSFNEPTSSRGLAPWVELLEDKLLVDSAEVNDDNENMEDMILLRTNVLHLATLNNRYQISDVRYRSLRTFNEKGESNTLIYSRELIQRSHQVTFLLPRRLIKRGTNLKKYLHHPPMPHPPWQDLKLTSARFDTPHFRRQPWMSLLLSPRAWGASVSPTTKQGVPPSGQHLRR